MQHIQQDRIGKHNRRLKDPEEPLILQNGTDVIHVRDIQTRSREVLDGPVDRAHRDQRAAAVQDVQGPLHFPVQHAVLRAVVVELGCQGDKGRHQDELQDECGLEERLARVLLALGAGGVGDADGAVGGDGFDHGAHGNEGREDAAWVDGGLVGDVVEDAAEGEEVGDFIDWSGGVSHGAVSYSAQKRNYIFL